MSIQQVFDGGLWDPTRLSRSIDAYVPAAPTDTAKTPQLHNAVGRPFRRVKARKLAYSTIIKSKPADRVFSFCKPASRVLRMHAHMLSRAALHPRNVRRNLHYKQDVDASRSPLTTLSASLVRRRCSKGHSPWAKLSRPLKVGCAQRPAA
jgi:hypothetical protein